MDDPTLADLFAEASRREVCWRIHCTTCGAGELRSGVFLLARRVPLRLVALPVHTNPELFTMNAVSDELPTVAWHRLASPRGKLRAAEADHLTKVCVEARLRDLARAAAFPDWLGYLGIILDELQGYDEQRLRIGIEWARQFTTMGGDPAAWERFKHEPISWRDLELAEAEWLGAQEARHPGDNSARP
jgi:hypothetical protein